MRTCRPTPAWLGMMWRAALCNRSACTGTPTSRRHAPSSTLCLLCKHASLSWACMEIPCPPSIAFEQCSLCLCAFLAGSQASYEPSMTAVSGACQSRYLHMPLGDAEFSQLLRRSSRMTTLQSYLMQWHATTTSCWTLTGICGPTSAWATSSSAPLRAKWGPPQCRTR